MAMDRINEAQHTNKTKRTGETQCINETQCKAVQTEDEPGHGMIPTERGTVHYWIRRHADASAPVLVFTHGVTANHRMFERQVEAFAGTCTVITWDVPLHGLSRPYRDFSYRHTAEDLRAILDAEGLSQVVLVGMSMGGYPSQVFAMRYPERVRAFVALDTTPLGLSYYSRTDQWWLRQVGWMANLFTDGMLRRSMAKSVSRTDYAREMMMAMLEPLTKREIVEQMEVAYGGFLRENADTAFRFPVIILLGEHDRTGKVRQYCEAWAKQTGYPLKRIPDAAHFANADNPEAVNREIRAFLDGLIA